MARTPDDLEVELCYGDIANWSLIWSGLPLILSCVARSAQPPPEGVTLSLSIDLGGRMLLSPTEVRISAGYLRGGVDVSGTVHALMRTRWLWLNTWEIETRTSASFRLRIGENPFELPLEVLPPVVWHRVLNESRQLGGPISCREVTIDGNGARWHRTNRHWQAAMMPPLEAAVAALINPRDPWVAYDPLAQGSFADQLDEQICNEAGVPRRRELVTVSAKKLLRALYMTILNGTMLNGTSYRHLPPADVFAPDSQVVRLLQWDHQEGVFCLDLVCLCCAALEARFEAPLFLLTQYGGHAAFGVLTKDASKELPATADPHQIQTLIENGRLSLLDVTLALSNVSYDEALARSHWSVLGKGFLHAVDIRTARSWSVERQKYEIPPYPWPMRESDWVAPYLRRLAEELRPSREEGSAGYAALHDPAELFVPLTCTAESATRSLFDSHKGPGLLDEQLVRRTGRLAILGDGGGGKTYACERLALDLAESYLRGEGSVVPIFYRLRLLARGVDDLLAAIATQVRECPGAAALGRSSNRLLFILDALDESDFGRGSADPKEYCRLFEAFDAIPQASVLLTARAALFLGAPRELLPTFHFVTLLGWDEADFDEYLRLSVSVKSIDFDGGWETFHRRIFDSDANRNLRELTRTPLFARMIVETRKQIESAATIGGELDLYRTYTTTCFERRRDAVRVELARGGTIEVARLMYVLKAHALPVGAIVDALAFYYREFGIDPWRRIVGRDFIVHGLLTREGEKELRFSHLSLEHYFLAELIARELEQSRASQGFSSLLGHAPLDDGVIAFVAQALQPNAGHVAEIGRKLDVEMEDRSSLVDDDVASRNVGIDPDANRLYGNVFLIHARAGGVSARPDLRELNLARADLSKAVLAHGDLSDAILRAATLVDADLEGCRLNGCDLREADVSGANLRSADLGECDLSFIRIRSPSSLPLVLSATNLDQVRLDPADATTIVLLLQAVAAEGKAAPEWAQSVRAGLLRRSGES